MVRSQGWTQTSHPSNLILLPLSLPRPIQIPHPAASHSPKIRAAGAQKKEKELPDQWGSFFCLSRLAFFLPAWACSVLQGCSSSGLGHWWHLSPLQRQAGETALQALIPALIIFKAAWIYITLMQAPVALQLPQEVAFLAFLSCLEGRDCHHGRKQLLGTTEASGQLVGFGCFPDCECFMNK